MGLNFESSFSIGEGILGELFSVQNAWLFFTIFTSKFTFFNYFALISGESGILVEPLFSRVVLTGELRLKSGKLI